MAGRHTRSVCVLVRGDRKVHPRRRRRLGFECTACGLLPGLRREELHRCVAHADTHPYGLRSETTVDYQVYEFQGRPTGRAEMCANVRCAWIPGPLVSREAVSPSKSPMSKRPRTSPGQNGPHGESEKKPKSPVKTSPNVPVSKRPQTSPGQNGPHGERARKNLSPPSKRPQTSPGQNGPHLTKSGEKTRVLLAVVGALARPQSYPSPLAVWEEKSLRGACKKTHINPLREVVMCSLVVVIQAHRGRHRACQHDKKRSKRTGKMCRRDRKGTPHRW